MPTYIARLTKHGKDSLSIHVPMRIRKKYNLKRDNMVKVTLEMLKGIE